MRRYLPSFLVALVIASGVVQPAEAVIIQYDSRATFDALAPYIPVDWSVFGTAGTVITTPDSRIVDGLTVQVSSSQGLLARHDEATDYFGTFAIGDALLTDAGSLSDTFIIRFGSQVSGFGTQIDAHFIDGPFTGTVRVYSVLDALLFEASFAGIHTLAEDNSAPFVGVASSLADISYATFWIDQPGFFPDEAGALAINRLDVLVAQVPEPSTLTLLMAGLLGLATIRRRKSDALSRLGAPVRKRRLQAHLNEFC